MTLKVVTTSFQHEFWTVKLLKDDNHVQAELKAYNDVINIRSYGFDKT